MMLQAVLSSTSRSLKRIPRFPVCFGTSDLRALPWMSASSFGSRMVHQERKAEEIRIPVPWGHIAGKWWGPKDVQPVLAMHGWLDNAATFDPLMSLLPANVSVLAVDLPGQGLSSHYPPGAMYHITEDMVTVRRIVQHFKWEKIKILGHSMGSTYAFLYAAFFPLEVEKIVCFDILRPYCVDSKYFVKTGGKNINGFIDLIESTKKSPTYELEDLIDRQFKASSESISKESCAILLSRGAKKCNSNGNLLELTRDIRLKYFAFFHALPHEALIEMTSRIKCEVLNIKGKQGMYYEKVEYYKQTLEILQSCAKRLEYIEVDGTHHFHLNNPEQIAPIILDFLFSDKEIKQ